MIAGSVSVAELDAPVLVGVLAQRAGAGGGGAAGGSGTIADVLMLVGVGVVAVVIAGVFIMRLRRGATERDGEQRLTTMEELRQMVNSGAISQKEYEALRRIIAQRVSASPARPADAPSDERRAGQPDRSRPSAASRGRETRAAADNPGLDNELRARPGFDLLGRPLPKPPTE